MTAPAPQTADAAALWNRLRDIGGDDGIELDQIIWKLRGLVARQPSDFLTRLAFAQSLLKRGRRDEATPHVEAAFGLRHGQGLTGTSNLACVLLDFGRLREAGEILARLLDVPEAAGDVELYGAAMMFALRTGDAGFLKRAISATRVEHGEAKAFVLMLEREGWVDDFRRHQEIVETILGPRTCMFVADIDYDNEGTLSAYLEYNTELTGRDRLALYRTLAEGTMGDDLVSLSPHVIIGICGPQVQTLESAA